MAWREQRYCATNRKVKTEVQRRCALKIKAGVQVVVVLHGRGATKRQLLVVNHHTRLLHADVLGEVIPLPFPFPVPCLAILCFTTLQHITDFAVTTVTVADTVTIFAVVTGTAVTTRTVVVVLIANGIGIVAVPAIVNATPHAKAATGTHRSRRGRTGTVP